MATVPHQESPLAHERGRRSFEVAAPEMWASLAIIAMWIVVLFDALFGPDMEFVDPGGSSTIPTVLPVAGCAFLSTWIVAAFAFRRERKSDSHWRGPAGRR